MSDRDKDVKILVLRHQITVLERQLGADTRVRFAPEDRAFLAALLTSLPREGSAPDAAPRPAGHRPALAPQPDETSSRPYLPGQAARAPAHGPLHPRPHSAPGSGEPELGLRADPRRARHQGRAVHRLGDRAGALLGTRFTMEQPLYRDRLAAHGFDVVVPRREQREPVHRVIFDELVRGMIRESSRDAYAQIIADLADDGAEGVIHGCTEIELLISEKDTAIPVLPSARLHAEAAAGFAPAD
ncbi:aspartate/glutamate racemase family protein [Nonomuraea angiospora]|uniref:aspartate/glutamate racemase family protein n=1 Tax=Nonomuraea angiospora TaxID=46172 RepID=UPI00343D5C6B